MGHSDAGEIPEAPVELDGYKPVLEYKIITYTTANETQAELNELVLGGWRLIAVVSSYIILERTRVPALTD